MIKKRDLISILGKELFNELTTKAKISILKKIVHRLLGSYNTSGVLRWFRRKRSQLNGRTPLELLTVNWTIESEQLVLSLARQINR